MLYWLGVYSFVVIAVLLPFALLYMVLVLSWLGLAAVRFTATIRMAFLRKYWSIPHRVANNVSQGTVGARL